MESSKVFISYSHDSAVHMERVLGLSNRLRETGIDCEIDQYEQSPPEGWPRWMVNRIEWADFVLVVCSEQYEMRFKGQEESGKGLGGKWEGAIITQELYDIEGKNIKFIPILFSPYDSSHIPILLRGATYYRIDTENGFEALYRRLTNQPLVEKPELGQLTPMTPRERKQHFSKIWKLPYPKSPFFTGRNEIIEQLHHILNSKGSIALQ